MIMLNLAMLKGPIFANYDFNASGGIWLTWHWRPPLVLLFQEVIDAVEAATAEFPRDDDKSHALMSEKSVILPRWEQHLEHLQCSVGTKQLGKKSLIAEV